MNPIGQNRIAFETAGPEYEKYYFDQQTGGHVLVHQGHNQNTSFASELWVGRIFAQEGMKVELTKESGESGEKQPDALIDGEP